jgi:hypothetical protein
MRRGARFPDEAAELLLSDVIVEQLAMMTAVQREDVLVDLVRLCADPGGRHPLRGPLAGWNTLDVLQARRRVVYRASIVEGVGLIEVLCLGPRSELEVVDLALALTRTGALTPEELTTLWDAFAILAIVAEDVGLDGWDFLPEPAPDGMRRAAVAAGLLPADVAALLSRDEVEAAMQHGWAHDGADPDAALVAALRRARDRAVPLDAEEAARVLAARRLESCGVVLPRAQRVCVRRAGHPGAHRSR